MGCAWLFTTAFVTAGPIIPAGKSIVAPSSEAEETQLDVFSFDTSYVFDSPIKFNHRRIAAGDEVHSDLHFLHRIPIRGNWYFQVGIDYERFDFGGGQAGPLPGTLQNLNAPIGVVYLVQNQIGFLAQIRPGVYFEHHIDTGAFDIPVEIGGALPLKKDKLFLVYGIGTSILREWPVIPTVGLVWIINDKWRLFGVAPEPRLEYSYNNHLTLWVGGELLVESFKTDPNAFALAPRQRSTTGGSVVDYTEYRVGLGATYTPVNYWDINVAAGYSLERTFDFWRADKSYTADPAPYVRVQLKASF